MVQPTLAVLLFIGMGLFLWQYAWQYCYSSAGEWPHLFSSSATSPKWEGPCMEIPKPEPSLLSPILHQVEPIMNCVCDYLEQSPAKSWSIDRWTEDVSQAVEPIIARLKSQLSSSLLRKSNSEAALRAFDEWLWHISLETDVLELEAIRAVLHEHVWDAHLPFSGVLGNISVRNGGRISIEFATIMRLWKRSGNIKESRRFFEKMINVEEGKGVFPLRFLYDTMDMRRTCEVPWPGLRKLVWPDPHDMLPANVGKQLQQNWRKIAGQAEYLHAELEDVVDAYPGIASGHQWTKLEIYSIGNGWSEYLCNSIPAVCQILRGQLKSENIERGILMRGQVGFDDECVYLFRVRGKGFVHLHDGVANRVNVHLCLLNCNYSRISVAGDVQQYSDGSLFAFEDRADHEIANEGEDDRIILMIGVLHPDWNVGQDEYLTPSDRLRFVLSSMEKQPDGLVPPKMLNDAFVIASYWGYISPMKRLLENRASVGAADVDGITAIHVASKNNHTDALQFLISNGANSRVKDSEGHEPIHFAAMEAADVVPVLMDHGASLHEPGPRGTPYELIARYNPDLAEDLKSRANEL